MLCKVEIYYCLNNNTICFSDFLTKYLRQEEIERAAEFVFPRDKQLYIISHAFLNNKLSKLFSKSLQEIVVINNKYGKPSLINNDLNFSLSHSKNSWSIALCYGNEIGVDIEEIKERNFKDILPSYFTINEQNSVIGSKEPITEFYRIWTRKEAILKALGVGLNYNLNEIDVCNNEVEVYSPVEKSNDKLFVESYKKEDNYLSIATFLPSKFEFNEVTSTNFIDFFSE